MNHRSGHSIFFISNYFPQAFNGNNDEIDCEKLETALYLFFTCINNSHRKLIGRQSKDYHMAIIGNLSINCLHVLNLTMNVMHKIPEPMHKVIMDIQRTLMAIFLSEHFRLRPIISELHLCQKGRHSISTKIFTMKSN